MYDWEKIKDIDGKEKDIKDVIHDSIDEMYKILDSGKAKSLTLLNADEECRKKGLDKIKLDWFN